MDYLHSLTTWNMYPPQRIMGPEWITCNETCTSVTTVCAPGHEIHCVHHGETLVREEARNPAPPHRSSQGRKSAGKASQPKRETYGGAEGQNLTTLQIPDGSRCSPDTLTSDFLFPKRNDESLAWSRVGPVPAEVPPNSASFLWVHPRLSSSDEVFGGDRNSDLKRKISTRRGEEADRITGKMEQETDTEHGKLAGGWTSGGEQDLSEGQNAQKLRAALPDSPGETGQSHRSHQGFWAAQGPPPHCVQASIWAQACW